jgi:hypothetical protein
VQQAISAPPFPAELRRTERFLFWAGRIDVLSVEQGLWGILQSHLPSRHLGRGDRVFLLTSLVGLLELSQELFQHRWAELCLLEQTPALDLLGDLAGATFVRPSILRLPRQLRSNGRRQANKHIEG